MANSERYSRSTLVALGVLGVLLPGMANYYLHEVAPSSGTCHLPAGFALRQPCIAASGDVVFAVGYLLAAYLLWRGWIRHVDFEAQ